jgi:hypothetical protein
MFTVTDFGFISLVDGMRLAYSFTKVQFGDICTRVPVAIIGAGGGGVKNNDTPYLVSK